MTSKGHGFRLPFAATLTRTLGRLTATDHSQSCSAALQRLTLLAVGLGAVLVELAIHDGEGWNRWQIAGALSWPVTVILAGARLTQRYWPAGGKRVFRIPTQATIFLAALCLLPLIVDPVRTAVLGNPRPLEVVLLSCLRNLGVGFAALAAWPSCARLAAFVSLFMVLTASTMTGGPIVLVLLAAYAIAAGCWLTVVYWDGLGIANITDRQAKLPLAAPVALLTLGAAVFAGTTLGPGQRVLAPLFELMPSSGGTGDYHAGARGGLNDGDDEVSGTQNARSIGFTDSQVTLDSPVPSFYDMLGDMFGEPVRPKSQERTIALEYQPPQRREQKHAENMKAGREFSLLRQSPKQRAELTSRFADALLYVEGKTPLHLRLLAYDRFDGVAWHEAAPLDRPCVLEKDRDPRWLRLARIFPPIHAANELHRVKVALLATAVLPVPAQLERFHMGRVNRADFFSWGQEDILRVNRSKIPPGTTIECDSRSVDVDRLAAVDMRRPPTAAIERYLACPEAIDPAVTDMAHKWAAGSRRGWKQIEAISSHLRSWCVHDRAACAAVDCPDIIGDFLLKRRHGPDYLFASAAAVMIRSLGYPTRVVSGLYVSPTRYDRKTGNTPVLTEDAHFWLEVLLPDGAWVAVEPTPGYELAGPSLTWTQKLWAAVAAAWSWSVDHALLLGILAIVLVLVYWFRRELSDLAATLRWRWATRGCWRRRVLGTVRLMDRRALWAGRARPPGQTLSRWYGRTAREAVPELSSDLERLIALADRAVHAPRQRPALVQPNEREVHATCHRVVRSMTLRRFRAVQPSIFGRSACR
jgi:hypothetical protein